MPAPQTPVHRQLWQQCPGGRPGTRMPTSPLPLPPPPPADVKGNWRYVCDTTHPQNPLLTNEAAQAGQPTLQADVIATCDKLGFEVRRVCGGRPSGGRVGGLAGLGAEQAASLRRAVGREGGGRRWLAHA